MAQLTGKAAQFLALHQPGAPLLQPNAFDIGSAKILESLGFGAIATTSGGFAGTVGRLDGQMSRDDVLGHCADLVAAVAVPVAADFENGFADEPAQVTANVALAAATGLAGCSVEDWSGSEIYEMPLAAERIAAAAEAAHTGTTQLVLTARAENLIRGRDDLADTIARLQAYQQAGADVLFAPGLRTVEQIKAVTESVEAPVNVLVSAGAPPLAEVAAAGAARISVGGSLAIVAYAALVEAANELRERGTYDAIAHAFGSAAAIRAAFGA
ncbi:MAG: isocitrate lyase/phosphoenolpyruvate mutase family protein [Actinobacteria bacterium]|nr:isocitrate lyase/phosphoenolpyruvate mutase family protein [Actinomycetota bacterium]